MQKGLFYSPAHTAQTSVWRVIILSAFELFFILILIKVCTCSIKADSFKETGISQCLL